MAVDRGAMVLHLGEQMGRVRRRDTLRSEVTADVQVGRVLLFLDGLMLLPRLTNFLLLRAAASFEFAIARVELAANARDVLVRLGDECFLGGQFAFARGTTRVRAPEAGLHHPGFLAGEPRPFRADPFQLRLQVGRRGVGRLQRSKAFFSSSRSACVVFLNAALDHREFFVAAIGGGFRLVAALDQGTLFFLELGQGGACCRVNFPVAAIRSA